MRRVLDIHTKSKKYLKKILKNVLKINKEQQQLNQRQEEDERNSMLGVWIVWPVPADNLGAVNAELLQSKQCKTPQITN